MRNRPSSLEVMLSVVTSIQRILPECSRHACVGNLKKSSSGFESNQFVRLDFFTIRTPPSACIIWLLFTRRLLGGESQFDVKLWIENSVVKLSSG